MIVVDSLEDLYDEDTEIYHHGTKGMHWGIRKYQNPDGSLTPAGRKRYMKNLRFRQKIDEKRLHSQKKEESAKEKHDKLMKSSDGNELYKRRSELSNDEIRDRINRMRLENELASYTTREPSKSEKMWKNIDKAMDVANRVAMYANTPVGKMAINKAKKALGIDDPDSKITNYKTFVKAINGKSDKDVKAMLDRASNELKLRRALEGIDDMRNPSPPPYQNNSGSGAPAGSSKSAKNRTKFQAGQSNINWSSTDNSYPGTERQENPKFGRYKTKSKNRSDASGKWFNNQPESRTETRTETRGEPKPERERTEQRNTERETFRPDHVSPPPRSNSSSETRRDSRPHVVDVDFEDFSNQSINSTAIVPIREAGRSEVNRILALPYFDDPYRRR